MDKQRFDGIFREICGFLHPEDGVEFDYEKINVAEIMEQRRYAGLEIKVPVSLGTMRQMMKIDIGFGDVVTPQPDFMTYPTLLDMNAPEIKAYSRETVIAEKFEAMIDLSESNSRMKDFYDIHQQLSQKQFDPETLQSAISQTFNNRGTIVRLKHPIFEASFEDDPTRNKLWEGFLQRSKLANSVPFSEVMQCIREHLKPIYENLF